MLLKPVVYVSTMNSCQFFLQVSQTFTEFLSQKRITSVKVETAMPSMLIVSFANIDNAVMPVSLIKKDIFETQIGLTEMQKITNENGMFPFKDHTWVMVCLKASILEGLLVDKCPTSL